MGCNGDYCEIEPMEYELRPCPFCGGKACGPTDAWPHMIVCDGCGARIIGVGFAEDGMREAVEKWNRRYE